MPLSNFDPSQIALLAVEAAPSGMMMVNATGHIELVNNRMLEIFGYQREELLGSSIDMLLPPEVREEHPQQFVDYLKNPTARAMGEGRELWGIRKDGQRIPIEIGLNPLELQGEMHVMAAVVDISERRRLDDMVRIAFEAAPNGMLMINQSGRIEMVNTRLEEIFGYSRGELLGEPIEMLVPPSVRGYHPELVKGFVAQPSVRRIGAGRDLSGFRKDGSRISVEIGLTPIVGKDCMHILAAVVDITDRKRSEEALKRYALSLEKTNSDLDDFTRVASHDLRSPLRAISCLATWVIDDAGDSLPPVCLEHLERMQGRIKRMQALLDDLLEYSRAGRSHGQIQQVDCRQMVKGIVEMLDVPAGFVINVAPDLPRLETLATPLETCLRNLIANAIKHHRGKEGRIDVTGSDTETHYEFVVTDDGPGIPPAFQKRIFEMFQTLQSRDEVEGSGVGLALIRRIVDSYEGKITVESEFGKGTTFRLAWNKSIAGLI